MNAAGRALLRLFPKAGFEPATFPRGDALPACRYFGVLTRFPSGTHAVVNVSAFHIAAAILSITLAACATTKPEPQIVTKEVQVPVMVKCHPDIGPEPDYPDTDARLKAAPDLFSKVQLLVAGRLMRLSRDAVKSAALSACEG